MDSMLRPDNQLVENSNTTLMEKEFAEQADWSPMVVLIAVLLGILIILTTAGNLVVCRLIWVCRRIQIPSLYFVASMSFSDFLMGLLVMPISLAYHINYQTTGRWIFGHFMCNLWLFLNFVLCSASIYNLCVVSGDRYLAVTSPLKYLSRMNDRRVKQIVGVSWFCAFLLAGFVTYGTNASKDNGVNCSVWGLRYEYSLVVLIFGYILPVFFLVYVNAKVFFIAHSHMNRIHAMEMASVSAFTIDRHSQGATSRTVQRSRLRREIKIFKTFVVVTCTFLLSWTPFVAILLVDSIWTVPELIRHSSIILLYCNSALNPFIYGFYNAEFRKLLTESIRCKCSTIVRKISPSY